MSSGKKHRHILVIRLSAMGDVAMTVPVLRALTRQHPNVKVTVVSRGLFRAFFEGIPNVHFFEPDLKRRHKGFLGILRLYKDLRRLHVHAVADLHNVLRSRIITFLFSLRGKKTATTDKFRKERVQLTALKADKIINPLPPVTERHAEVFAQLGYPLDVNAVPFPPKQPLTEDITDVTGPKNGIWIGIAPFAQHRGKVYPADLMQQVINGLAADTNTTLFLFGSGRQEAKLLDDYAQKPNVKVVAGARLILRQELKLISHLNLMLSMDSSNAHMAAMLGVPVVTLWGATHPYAGFAPFKQPLDNALTASREQYPMLPTSIYGNKIIEGYGDAMRSISPQTVIDKVKEIIKA